MKTFKEMIKLSGIGLLVMIATGIKAQCNLTATSTQTNVSCNGGSNGSITVNVAGSTGPLTYGIGGGSIMPSQQFNSNVFSTDTSGKGWYAPAENTAISYHATGGCPGGMAGFSGSYTNYWGNFIRTPKQNCNRNTSVIMSFDITNAYNPSHVTYYKSPADTTNDNPNYTGDGMSFNIWTNTKIYTSGIYLKASSIKINGTEVGYVDVNGPWLRFDTVRSCVHVEVTFPLDVDILADGTGRLDTITNISNVYFYLNAYNQFNDSLLFNFSVDNISVNGNAPSSWQSSDTFNNLAAGIYNIELQDSLGCAASVSDTITQPAPLLVNISQTGRGNCNDTAEALVSGGVAPYTIQWSNGANQRGDSETHICQDTLYFVNATDFNGCMISDLVIGGGLGAVINTSPSQNCGILGCTGRAWAIVTGGVAPYTYHWSGGVSTTNDTATGLCIGVYSVTVKDAVGDSVIQSATIAKSPSLAISTSVKPNSGCNSICNGAITINIVVPGSGGPYRYQWADIGMTVAPSRTGLCPAIYGVTVTDGECGETATATDTISQTPALSETLTTYSSCNGPNSGKITAIASGGTGPYLYSVNTGQVLGVESFDTSNSLITGDTAVYSAWYSPGTCTGGGMIWDSIGGCAASGAVGYTASPGTGNGCYLRSPLVNCSGLSKVTMTFDLTNNASPFGDSIWFYVWSQNNGKYYPSCIGAGCGTIIDSINGVATSNVSLVTSRSCQVMTVLFNLSSIPSADRNALYFYLKPSFKEAAGYSFNALFDNITLSASSPIYLWQPNNVFNNLAPGAYAVAAMDSLGCFATMTDTVGGGGNFSVAATTNSPVCAGDTIVLYNTISLGATFSWSGPRGLINTTPPTVPNATSYDSGNYIVSVVSDSGCLATDTIDVVVYSAIIDSVAAGNASCDGICNGTAAVEVVMGGTPPYSYNWVGGSSPSGMDSNLCAGTYVVTITDVAGCIKTDSVVVGNSSLSCDVWPGDANDDGVVDNNDILEIGLGYSFTGPVRVSASLAWVAQAASNWDSILPPGVNAKFADCDGNGIINADDTLAVNLNYSFTHPKNGGYRDNGPLLYIQLPAGDSVLAGQTVQVPIYLGTQNIPVGAIAGLAFSVSYNSALVDSIMQLSASGSWMGTPGSNLLTFSQNIYNSGITDIAITRTDHANASGYGPLCIISYVMKDDISGKTEISKALPFTISNVTAITAKGTSVPLSYGAVDTVIAYQNTGIAQISLSNSLRIYPNPAGQYIIADAGKVVVDEYTIIDMLGSELKIINVKQQAPLTIDVTSLSAGIYFLRARSGKELATLKFSVIR